MCPSPLLRIGLAATLAACGTPAVDRPERPAPADEPDAGTSSFEEPDASRIDAALPPDDDDGGAEETAKDCAKDGECIDDRYCNEGVCIPYGPDHPANPKCVKAAPFEATQFSAPV